MADPADPDSCVTALLAAQDAISVGQLVVVTHGPGFTGFYASLHAEYPNLGITVLRVPESTDGLRAAQRLAAVQPGRFVELVIDVAGRPHETRMVPVEATGLGNFPLGPADVVLVSQGAGGSGLALAQVLACCGAAIAVLGPDMPGSDGEGMAGLEQLRAAGARVGSEVVDLTNKADMAAAVRRIERKLGLVTAIVQAAEPSAPRPLGGLTEPEMRAHVAAQTMGLSQLLGAIRPERLRLIATFGSIASRYGMGRASLLALASGSLASQAERAAETIPGCRALHIDWPAWSGPEQAERPAMTDRLARAGVTVIGVNEGSRLLLKMLTTPDFPASVAVHGRIGLLGRPPAAGHLTGRFLQAVRTYYPGVELVCEARISPRTDQYLADYLVDGVSVLPAAMALEALAQAASVLAGRPVRRAVGVSVDSPVVVRTGGADPGAVIRICALRDGDTVTAVLRCEESSFAVDHVRAVFSCGLQAADAATSRGAALPELEEVAASDAGIVDGTELYRTICFQSGRFRRAALLPEVTSRSCRALVEGDDNQAWFSGLADPADAQLVLGSPGLTDATWHVLQACVPHRRLQLAGCDSVLFSGLAADGAVEVRAALARDPRQQATTASSALRKSVVPAQSPGPEAITPPAGPSEYVWDVEAVDSAGLPIVTWRGLRLRDTGPLARTESWPPALLAAYLERSAAALGLDPELRIAVRCGQPDGTAPRDAAHAVVPKPSPAADERPRPQAVPGSGPAVPPETSAGGPAGAAGGPLAACAATGSGALAGFTLTVWAADSVACGWAAAEPARERQPTADQSKVEPPRRRAGPGRDAGRYAQPARRTVGLAGRAAPRREGLPDSFRHACGLGRCSRRRSRRGTLGAGTRGRSDRRLHGRRARRRPSAGRDRDHDRETARGAAGAR